MQITVQVGNALVALNPGQPLPVSAGDTLRVFYAFNYKVAETTGVEIWASLYRWSDHIYIDRQEEAQTKQTITLEKALTYQPYEGEIDIVVGQINSGTYGLICEFPDFDVEGRIDDCIEVAAAPSIWGTVGTLLALGLMAAMVSMMAPMMKEGGI